MAKITLKGNPIETSGNLPVVGSTLKNFVLRATDLSDKSLSDFEGKKKILNIFPSVDTETCAASVRKFNASAAEIENTVVLCISRDLPFAQSRFCGAEGLDNVVMLSDFESGEFGLNNGLQISNGPLKGLHSRCILVLNEQNEVIHTEQVAETVDEPDYEKALAVL